MKGIHFLFFSMDFTKSLYFHRHTILLAKHLFPTNTFNMAICMDTMLASYINAMVLSKLKVYARIEFVAAGRLHACVAYVTFDHTYLSGAAYIYSPVLVLRVPNK